MMAAAYSSRQRLRSMSSSPNKKPPPATVPRPPAFERRADVTEMQVTRRARRKAGHRRAGGHPLLRACEGIAFVKYSLVFPAKAGTHLAAASDFSGDVNVLPTLECSCSGEMGPGLRGCQEIRDTRHSGAWAQPESPEPMNTALRHLRKGRCS